MIRCSRSRRGGWPFGLGVVTVLFAGGVSAQPAAPVEVVMPEVGQAVRTLELTGSFNARRSAQLSPRVPGLVAEVTVDAGDRVRAGDVLVRLDQRLAELEVRRAEAALQQRQAALAEVERLLAESRRLGRDSYLPETQVEARQAEVALARAALSSADSELATAREQLLRHTVVAPFDGTIVRKMTEAGEWVQTGSAVAELVNIDELWLDVRAPQQYWPELAPDTEVAATADAVPERILETRVHARVPVSDPSARTFLVRLIATNLGADVTPGMSGRARFQLTGAGDVLRVPRDALMRYPDGTTTVWVIDRQQDLPRAREVEVTAGRYVGDQVEIAAGLEPTQPVIIRGNEVLTQDQNVRVVSPGDS
jgi:RND family efflux transporter MFP subunit